MAHYAMAIDITRCFGCQTCAVACKMANNLPIDTWWNRVLTVGGDFTDTAEGTFPEVKMSFMPVACQHCEHPACVEVCPVGATYKDEETGIVMQDPSICIGCRYCIDACPYNGVRTYSEGDPEHYADFAMGDADAQTQRAATVSKCTFCSQRVARGQEPACVTLCPARARAFGDLDDPDSDVSKAIKDRDYTKLLEDEGTNPSIYYLV